MPHLCRHPWFDRPMALSQGYKSWTSHYTVTCSLCPVRYQYAPLHHVVEHLQHMFCPWHDRPRTIWQCSQEIGRKFLGVGVHCKVSVEPSDSPYFIDIIVYLAAESAQCLQTTYGVWFLNRVHFSTSFKPAQFSVEWVPVGKGAGAWN